LHIQRIIINLPPIINSIQKPILKKKTPFPTMIYSFFKKKLQQITIHTIVQYNIPKYLKKKKTIINMTTVSSIKITIQEVKKIGGRVGRGERKHSPVTMPNWRIHIPIIIPPPLQKQIHSE
jgi:hypothetical protein